MFFRLGMTNARRNLSRSLLSIISMAVAAMVLSGSLTLAAGYPAQAYVPHRIFAGGDIMIFPKALSLSAGSSIEGGQAGGDSGVSGGADLEFARLERDWVTELYSYCPESYDYGVFMSAGRQWFDLADITARLKELDFIVDVYPYLVLPAFERFFDRLQGYTKGGLTVIRGRSIDKDLNRFFLQDYVAFGRPLSVVDEGLMRAVVDIRRGATAGYGQPGEFSASFGGTMEVLIPKLTMPDGVRPDGEPATAIFDYSAGTGYRFRVIGGYTLPGTVSVGGREMVYSTPQILIPDDVFSRIWAEVTGGAPVAVPQVSVSVSNLTTVESQVARLREALPDCTVVSVPVAAAAGAARGGLPEQWSQWRRSPGGIGVMAGQVTLPPEVKYILLVLTSLLAALVVAANSLVMLTHRRREIGVLRAIGAKRRDVMAMVLAEVALVSALGAVCGFGIVRFAVVWNQLSSKTSIGAIGAAVLADGLKVVGACVACAVLFGLAPAMRSTSISTMEVLREE